MLKKDQIPDVSDKPSFFVPFVIGVTGHRDLRLEDILLLEKRVRSVLDDFRRRLPSTPLVVLSALAEGADQLVARVALQCGLQLAAVLPMPTTIYRAQMETQAQQSFDELLSKASLVLSVTANGVSDVQLKESEEARAQVYDALGIFLAKQSQVLIALWDGMPSEKKGGTARVVRYMLEGPPACTNLGDNELDTGIVYQIMTPRTSSEAPDREIAKLRLLTCLDGMPDKGPAEFEVSAQRLEAFNRDVAKIDVSGSPACGTLVPEESSRLISAYERRVSQVYYAADKCSLDFNGWTSIALVTILGFAFVALASFEIYAHVLPHNAMVWLVYPIALLGAWLTYRIARKRDVETKYLDYRALAEALRVQFFWSLAGVGEAAADHYLRDHRTELDWIRFALRSISIYETRTNARGQDEVHRMVLALNHWVGHQASWYAAKSKQQQTILKRLDHISGRFLFAVWFVSMLIPISLLTRHPGLAGWQKWASEEPHHGLLLLLIPLPSVAFGLFRVWVEQAGYDVQARKYHHMAQVFRRAADRLKEYLKQSKIEEARDILRRLGVDALEENGDWLILHREHPLRVVGSP